LRQFLRERTVDIVVTDPSRCHRTAERGKSIIANDTSVPPIVAPLLPATAFFNLWGADVMPSLPDVGAEPSYLVSP
jgi:hypothetical protein